MTPVARKSFNYIYEKLVKDENDILGHIAYSVYKSQKLTRIAEMKKASGGNDVTDEDMAPFLEMSQSKVRMGFYLDRATTLAQQFLDEGIGEELEMEKKKLESEFIQSHRTRCFMYGVMQGVVASFIFVLAGFALLMATGGWARIGKALIEIAK